MKSSLYQSLQVREVSEPKEKQIDYKFPWKMSWYWKHKVTPGKTTIQISAAASLSPNHRQSVAMVHSSQPSTEWSWKPDEPIWKSKL